MKHHKLILPKLSLLYNPSLSLSKAVTAFSAYIAHGNLTVLPPDVRVCCVTPGTSRRVVRVTAVVLGNTPISSKKRGVYVIVEVWSVWVPALACQTAHGGRLNTHVFLSKNSCTTLVLKYKGSTRYTACNYIRCKRVVTHFVVSDPPTTFSGVFVQLLQASFQ